MPHHRMSTAAWRGSGFECAANRFREIILEIDLCNIPLFHLGNPGSHHIIQFARQRKQVAGFRFSRCQDGTAFDGVAAIMGSAEGRPNVFRCFQSVR